MNTNYRFRFLPLLITAVLLLTAKNDALSDWEVLDKIEDDIEWHDVYARGDYIIAVGYTVKISQEQLKSTSYLNISDDGGESFSLLKAGDYFFLKTVSFTDNDHGIIGGFGQGDYNIWINCDDGGFQWQMNIDQSSGGIADIMFLDDKTGFASGYGEIQLEDGLLHKSTDGGLNWNPGCESIDEKTFDKVQFLDEYYGFTLSSFLPPGMLHKTTDGGKTWENVLFHKGYLVDMHFWDQNRGMVLGTGAIFRTEDGGASWQTQELDFVNVFMNSFTFLDEKNGYMVGSNFSYEGMIFKTTDGGYSWEFEDVGRIPYLRKVEFHGDHAYAIGNACILKSIEKTSVIEKQLTEKTVEIYPNPVRTEANFLLPDIPGNELKITIYDMTGRKVKELNKINQSHVSFNRDGLFSGCYYYTVYSDGVYYAAGKLIIE